MPRHRTVQYYGPAPSVPFVVICRAFCFAQFLSSLAVLIPITLFVSALRSHLYTLPGTFYFLASAAMVTLVAVPALSLISWRQRLTPLNSLLVNTLLTTLWAASFGVVVSRLGNVIFKQCGGKARATPCKLYVVIFIGGIVGLASCVGAALGDMLASRRQLPKIKYTKAQMSTARDSEILFDHRGRADIRPYDSSWQAGPSHYRSRSVGALAPSPMHSRSSSPALSQIGPDIFTECRF